MLSQSKLAARRDSARPQPATRCRFCGGSLVDFLNLGMSPLCENFLAFAPDKIAKTKPDYVLILPWNLKEEITAQLAYIRDWGGKFIVPIPELSIA